MNRFIFKTACGLLGIWSHNKPIRQALEEVNFSNLLAETGGL